MRNYIRDMTSRCSKFPTLAAKKRMMEWWTIYR